MITDCLHLEGCFRSAADKERSELPWVKQIWVIEVCGINHYQLNSPASDLSFLFLAITWAIWPRLWFTGPLTPPWSLLWITSLPAWQQVVTQQCHYWVLRVSPALALCQPAAASLSSLTSTDLLLTIVFLFFVFFPSLGCNSHYYQD